MDLIRCPSSHKKIETFLSLAALSEFQYGKMRALETVFSRPWAFSHCVLCAFGGPD
jgi:hypothetical protein